jgi:hypothetical protein
MKKTLRIMGLCALAALTIVSCKKDDGKAGKVSFQATLTQPTEEGRTHIGTDNWLMWDNNDAIKLFTADGTSATFTTHDANVTTATFSGDIDEADAYCAFYPAAQATGLNTDGKVVLTLANEQQYAEGGFANGTYPMAAYTTGTTFEFHSPCGLLAIPMKGTATVTSIELTGKLNEPLAGQLLIDPVGFNPTNPTYTLGDYQTKVTLNCGSGVTLDANTAKTFYFVVPKNVFAQGFTAVVKNGGTEITRMETTHNNIIAAERIRLMPEVTVIGGGEGGDEHAYVDLGLPSGLLWATCNVGADTPEAYGDYFAWGETTPKDYYDWSNYQYCNGSYNTLTKYCNYSSYGYNGFTDDLTTLLPEDDAATANWGNGWRMPTIGEFEELYNNTTATWTQQNGVNGRLFTAANGNSLFLPAAGYRWYDELDGDGYDGPYWSSSLYTFLPYQSRYFGVYPDGCGMSYGIDRYRGFTVRPVREN